MKFYCFHAIVLVNCNISKESYGKTINYAWPGFRCHIIFEVPGSFFINYEVPASKLTFPYYEGLDPTPELNLRVEKFRFQFHLFPKKHSGALLFILQSFAAVFKETKRILKQNLAIENSKNP